MSRPVAHALLAAAVSLMLAFTPALDPTGIARILAITTVMLLAYRAETHEKTAQA